MTLAPLALLCAVFGLVVGSFLNVVVWRVPRGESVVSPPSHCPGCNAAVRPRDNIPLLSWLLLRGRCRDCSAPISARYPLVEAATAALFVGMALTFGYDVVLVAFVYLAAISVALALIDLDHKRLPNVIVLPSYPVVLVLLGIAALVNAQGDDWIRAVEGMAALFAFYFVLAFVYPSGMGFGDVKLAGVLGGCLGWLGWGQLVLGGFLGFLFGAVVGIALMVIRRAGRKSQVPFGPFMLAGALVAVWWGEPIVHAYLGTT